MLAYEFEKSRKMYLPKAMFEALMSDHHAKHQLKRELECTSSFKLNCMQQLPYVKSTPQKVQSHLLLFMVFTNQANLPTQY
jgi:hypothetical protein